MPFISDSEATKIAKEVFSPTEYAVFVDCLEKMRQFERCLETNTPSLRCCYIDRAENLNWCRLGLHVETTAFEHYMQEVIPCFIGTETC
jgi:hypothetical protein